MVVDNDIDKYETIQALEIAIKCLENSGISWEYVTFIQENARNSNEKYDAIIIDNDFGEGMITLSQKIKTGIPIGYITAYDLEGLRLQYEKIPKALFAT